MDDRFNTIAGWVLFAGIVALGSSIVAGEMCHSERPEKMGYPIAGVEQEGEGGAAAAQPIEVYLAKADPAKGQQVFNKCMACHNADKGGANQLGPNLWGVIGEPVGQGKGFAFSPALSGKGGNWDWHSLDA
jgi:cytochrome c